MSQADATKVDLRQLPVALIDRNPDNPRINFRPGELEDLVESIRQHGVQVPISVYRENDRYVLIDGERRWRCSVKLNKKTIPALIQEKPDRLTNLLLMFNIHSLREQWDLLTIALKLPVVIELLTEQLGHQPTEKEIADATGLSRGVVRRCGLLKDLPEEYKDTILDELNKPKAKQRISEDLFIEMERALKTVERAMPGVIDDKDRVRRVLLDKYANGTIANIVHFRNVSKIARAQNVDADPITARTVLVQLFDENDYSVASAYQDSVSVAYNERGLATKLRGVIERLEELQPYDADDEIREMLKSIVEQASRILGAQ